MLNQIFLIENRFRLKILTGRWNATMRNPAIWNLTSIRAVNLHSEMLYCPSKPSQERRKESGDWSLVRDGGGKGVER